MPSMILLNHMKKIIIVGAVVLVLIVAIIIDLKFFNQPEQVACTMEAKICPDGSAVGKIGPNCEFALCPAEALCEGGECSVGYKNISYEINGQATQYFGNETRADFNGDGFEDIAFLLTQDGGGSGTFSYVVVALATKSGYQGTNGILLGDRIAPQTTKFQNGEIIVNYADRKIDEPMTATPSVGVSRYFTISDNKLIEIKK